MQKLLFLLPVADEPKLVFAVESLQNILTLDNLLIYLSQFGQFVLIRIAKQECTHTVFMSRGGSTLVLLVTKIL